MIGSTIGPYRITQQLGEGGMGVVYRATDTMLEREVALKALHPQLTRDESRLQRFRAEAVALARLHHPNIATLFNFFEQDGVYHMVMEFVDGQTLEDAVQSRGALALRPALELFCDALKGFEHAHARGVIHRDIKPSNLMLGTDGSVKITDFGIARVAGGGKLTQTGKLIGTLEYMSPEQVRGQEQDARSDIYSLGILLFELVTGRMPWSATSDFDIMRAHLEEPPPPARSLIAALPPELDAFITTALAKDPAQRFQNVAQMRQSLEAVLRDLPTTIAAAPPISPPTRVVQPLETNSFPPPPTGAFVPPVPVAPMPTSVVSLPSSAARPKWLWPAIALGGAVLVLGGLMASKRTPAVTPDPVPTAVPALVRDNDAAPNKVSGSGPAVSITKPDDKRLGEAKPGGNLSGIEIPQNLPGLGSPDNVPPKPAAKPPKATTPSKPAVSRPTRRERPVVERRPQGPTRRPRIRTVRRPAPAAKPRVARERPRRVVRQPVRRVSKPRRSGGGGGEAAALRALIKGG